MTSMFQAVWCGVGLGAYRPCAGTYERYPYSSIPPLDKSQFTGTFSWFPNLGEIDPARVALMEDLDRRLAAVGLALPADFVMFHTNIALPQELGWISVTGCWDDFSEQLIPSPVEPGAFLVRFFNDQQDCVTWYLYLRPSGETFVVHSYGLEFSVDDDETPAYLRPGTFPAYLDPSEYAAFATIYWCAPSVEQFAYRFWIENRLWLALENVPAEPLAADLETYLDYYRHAHEVSDAPQ